MSASLILGLTNDGSMCCSMDAVKCRMSVQSKIHCNSKNLCCANTISEKIMASKPSLILHLNFGIQLPQISNVVSCHFHMGKITH